ncbi:hypothetical protein PS627_01872 [Pseudomonas fluorescens]|uniref:response regulator n=1 Tax=Pseudomonas fluorescens TaxID=294 RepID=UPI001255D382|nr:response regulator [Pseudomonas fluorescens]CAG8866075.1 hypothetical protein PS627_01872 [Pseudomonas fluorescens]VVP75533.1 hypothetical protein PS910_01449 [Pseudomonas fluorescens]
MHRLNVLILQDRPFHLMHLHQAFNALGVFRVRVAEDQPSAERMLKRESKIDLLVLDHGMASQAGASLLEQLASVPRTRAVLFVGRPEQDGRDLAAEARRLQLWVLGELRWPLSMSGLRGLLQRFRKGAACEVEGDRQTVMLAGHAH